jgi:hypothetical protein
LLQFRFYLSSLLHFRFYLRSLFQFRGFYVAHNCSSLIHALKFPFT